MKSEKRWWQNVEVWIFISFLFAILLIWLWFEYQLYLLEQQTPEWPK